MGKKIKEHTDRRTLIQTDTKELTDRRTLIQTNTKTNTHIVINTSGFKQICHIIVIYYCC